MTIDSRDYGSGWVAGRRWLKGRRSGALSQVRLGDLPRNMERLYRRGGDRGGRDEAAGYAAAAYAALTGEFEPRSEAAVQAFWAAVLPGALHAYNEAFFSGFLSAVVAEVV